MLGKAEEASKGTKMAGNPGKPPSNGDLNTRLNKFYTRLDQLMKENFDLKALVARQKTTIIDLRSSLSVKQGNRN